ncbi:MAG: folylpolyglutamate synthase/dihydrofolate synthase family protein [Candidatus Bipolaricaulota bacterium]
MDYGEARALLDGLPRFLVKPGLSRVQRLLESLGSPERAFPAVHVTGTNGKGSVVAMLESILRAAGYRVGRYTSPDVEDFRDRITVQGRWISEEEFASLAEDLERPILSAADAPSQFEAITALGFGFFQRQSVDVAVVEVGLGGRFDATNVVRPELCVVTRVALDHTDLLGTTTAAIAWEKAGIAKRGIPLLLGAADAAVSRVVESVCAETAAPLRRVERVRCTARSAGSAGVAYGVAGADLPALVLLPLAGAYQRENLEIALEGVLLLRERGWTLTNDAVSAGLAAVRWPGRFEILRERPTIILDGAHNVDGAKALRRAVVAHEPRRARRILVLGVLKDKDAEGIVRVLGPHFAHLVLTASASPRALPPGELRAVVRRTGIDGVCYDPVDRAVSYAVQHARPTDTVVVAGSLTVVAEARRAMGGR